MIQQFHFWVYTAAPPELKAGVEETCAPCPWQHCSQQPKCRSIQVSVKGRMDRQNVVCAYNRIPFSLKKERNADTCHFRDEP